MEGVFEDVLGREITFNDALEKEHGALEEGAGVFEDALGKDQVGF